MNEFLVICTDPKQSKGRYISTGNVYLAKRSKYPGTYIILNPYNSHELGINSEWPMGWFTKIESDDLKLDDRKLSERIK